MRKYIQYNIISQNFIYSVADHNKFVISYKVCVVVETESPETSGCVKVESLHCGLAQNTSFSLGLFHLHVVVQMVILNLILHALNGVADYTAETIMIRVSQAWITWPDADLLVPIYTPGQREALCLAQEHNTVSPAKARTWTARFGDKRTNHEATAPPLMQTYMYIKPYG